MTVGAAGPIYLGATSFKGETSQSWNPGVQLLAGIGTGVSQNYLAKLFQNASFTFMVKGLATAHGICPLNGFVKVTSAAPFIAWTAYRTANGDLTGFGDFVSIDEGILVCLEVIGVQGPQEFGMARFGFFASSASGASPFTFSEAQAVVWPASEEIYTVGAFTANVGAGVVAYDDVQSIRFDPGVRIRPSAGSGRIFPRAYSVMNYAPRLSVGFEDVSAIGDIGLLGSSVTSVIGYLKEVTNKGTPTGGSADISFTCASGIATIEGLNSEEGDVSGVGLNVDPANATVANLFQVSAAATSP